MATRHSKKFPMKLKNINKNKWVLIPDSQSFELLGSLAFGIVLFFNTSVSLASPVQPSNEDVFSQPSTSASDISSDGSGHSLLTGIDPFLTAGSSSSESSSSSAAPSTGAAQSTDTTPSTFDVTIIVTDLCELFALLEGSLGALLMIVAGIGSIIAVAFGSYRSSSSLIVVAIGAFIARSMTEIWFGPISCGGSGPGQVIASTDETLSQAPALSADPTTIPRGFLGEPSIDPRTLVNDVDQVA